MIFHANNNFMRDYGQYSLKINYLLNEMMDDKIS